MIRHAGVSSTGLLARDGGAWCSRMQHLCSPANRCYSGATFGFPVCGTYLTSYQCTADEAHRGTLPVHVWGMKYSRPEGDPLRGKALGQWILICARQSGAGLRGETSLVPVAQTPAAACSERDKDNR